MYYRYFQFTKYHFQKRFLILSLCGLALLSNGANAAPPKVVKFTPEVKLNELSKRSDSDLVEFSNGRKIRIGTLRRLEKMRPKLNTNITPKIPQQLQYEPATKGGLLLRDAIDLSASLKRPDSDTVVLPSGRRATVGQIRFLQPMLEKKLGKSLAAIGSGKVKQVDKNTSRDQWQAITKLPANTLLVSPNGKRITVKALNDYLAIFKASSKSTMMPLKSSPKIKLLAPKGKE